MLRSDLFRIRNTRRETNMNATAKSEVTAELDLIDDQYGFGRSWMLRVKWGNVFTRCFYLGQDAKVCSRLLGLEPRELAIEVTGVNAPMDLGDEATKSKLATYLLNHIVGLYQGDGDPYADLLGLEPWELSVV